MHDKLRAIEQLVKRDGLVVGPEDFSAAFSRYREEGAERASEVAELLVLPVKEALENLDRQRFAGSEDGAECRTDFLAKLLQVRELPLEELAEDAAEPLWKLVQTVKREVLLLEIVTAALDVEKHPFALFEDLPDKTVGVWTVLELRREFAAKIVEDVGCRMELPAIEHLCIAARSRRRGIQPVVLLLRRHGRRAEECAAESLRRSPA